MSRIAYIDHSFHKKTISTKFIPDMLVRRGHVVDFFWDEAWQGGTPLDWKEVADYDAIIMFQSCIPVYGKYYSKLHPNVTYIPMLDQFGVWCGPLFNLTEFWEPFQGCKVLNFSSALHAMVNGFGIKSKFVRYYQPVQEKMVTFDGGLRGFFWLRREDEIPWSTVRALIDGTHFESFHLHMATDPGFKQGSVPSSEDIIKYNITISTWFDQKTDFENVLTNANVFFAPRAEEGIGQSVLEAFVKGQCVVAPNQGTMNEYILNGINGILYEIENPQPLDFTIAQQLGTTGWHVAKRGYENWLKQEKEIVSFMLTPADHFYSGKYDHFENKTLNKSAQHGRRWLKGQLKRILGQNTSSK